MRASAQMVWRFHRSVAEVQRIRRRGEADGRGGSRIKGVSLAHYRHARAQFGKKTSTHAYVHSFQYLELTYYLFDHKMILYINDFLEVSDKLVPGPDSYRTISG